MNDKSVLELIRVSIPQEEIVECNKTSKFFDIYDNSQNITEEFLYAHQPITEDIVPIYSTSEVPIGKLDMDTVTEYKLNQIDGPAIVVARKGYAGRLFVVRDIKFIVHEDAYPIKPKNQYLDKIDLDWFALHYNEEFQANRTSAWGIGDFPRARFNNMIVCIPNIGFQKEIADLYIRRKIQIDLIKEFETTIFGEMDKMILEGYEIV